MAFKLQAFLKAVDGGKTRVKYRKGETVFAQGDRCDGVFYIQSGDCKVSVVSEQGKEAIVAVLGAAAARHACPSVGRAAGPGWQIGPHDC